MKTLIIIIIFLFLFGLCFYIVLDKINYGVVSQEDYINDTPCDFSQLKEGWTQISNCAKYKFVGFNDG